MPVQLSALSDLPDLPFDEIIDVRSEAEFAEDHIPGAINLPALNNQERARVGTIYTQVNPFEARKIGAALVAQNAARHMQETLADRPRDYRPLVYCWRGGQRSGAIAIILQQAGRQAQTVDGGYRSYRRLVQQALYEGDWPGPVVVLDGNTGTAKTELLPRLQRCGLQVLDLEGLANHRGSIFGARAGGQPAQKAFESALAQAARSLDPARPLLVEGESSKIGDINLPPALWEAMTNAPRVEITAPLAARSAYLARTYGDIADDPAALLNKLDALSTMHSAERLGKWRSMAQDGALTALAQGLMQEHYDPRYAKQRSRFATRTKAVFDLPDLTPEALDAVAPDLADCIERFTAG